MTAKATDKFTERPVSIKVVLHSNKRGERLEADKRGGDSERKDSSSNSKQRALT